MTVPLEPTPWPDHKAERISVNSYGIGGSNVHVSWKNSSGLSRDHSGNDFYLSSS